MPYQEQIKKVPGLKVKEIMLFTLSTCAWCKKTKILLNGLGLEYSYADVDLLSDTDREEAHNEMLKYNINPSFPTIVINNGEDIIVGFEEERLKRIK